MTVGCLTHKFEHPTSCLFSDDSFVFFSYFLSVITSTFRSSSVALISKIKNAESHKEFYKYRPFILTWTPTCNVNKSKHLNWRRLQYESVSKLRGRKKRLVFKLSITMKTGAQKEFPHYETSHCVEPTLRHDGRPWDKSQHFIKLLTLLF